MACLELISLSSRVLEQTDGSYDLVFDLSSKALPAFSAIDCWRRSSISPLRDRVMIEWLFSHYEAELLLKTITTAINEAMKERLTTLSTDSSNKIGEKGPSSALRVAIGCQNGAQHSVCFVEKLYEQYSFGAESPLELVDGVKVEVKRRHCEATKGEWLNTKDAVWQHSQFPVKRIPHHRVLLFNRAWSNFPLESVRQIEAAFLENPFTTGVDIGKHVINYERGILYNKLSEEEFRIRSIIPSSVEKVHSLWLQDDEYSQLHKSYTSAGILFYSVHPQTGEAVFLLGHMTYGAMAWCDFGGIRKFVERAKYTAARECYEETFGILGKTKHLVSMLENYKENNVFKIVNQGTKYVGHFLRVPYKDYPTAFEKALEVTATDEVEVDEMRWFSLSSLRSGVQKALLDQPVFKVEPLNEDGSIDSSRQLPLRIEFLDSLCIADQLGVLNSIEHIAKSLHAENQPPPPSYVSYPKPRQSSKSWQSAGLASESNSVTTEKENTEAVGTTNKLKDDTWSEENQEEHLNSVQSEEKGEKLHQVYDSDNSLDRPHSGNLALLQPCNTNTSPESSSGKLKETTSAGITSMEVDGLRRRKKREERENHSSKAVDLDSAKKKVDHGATIDTSKTIRNVHYGIGAGTFLY